MDAGNLEDVPSMEEVLEQTAAAILGLDPDYSTQQVRSAASSLCGAKTQWERLC
eukprot:COSAG02_NODE_67244_length_253_cov_0.811688_1_plen_53_part_10